MVSHPDARIERLARRQGNHFSRAQAVAAGFTRHQVQRRVDTKRWLRPAPAVFALPGPAVDLRSLSFRATLHAGPGSFVGGPAGAVLRELDGIQSARVTVTVPRRVRKIPNVDVHYVPNEVGRQWSMVDGLPVAVVPRILLDLSARGDSLEVLERVFEDGHRRGLITPSGLDQYVAEMGVSGRNGITRLRELSELVVRDGRVNASGAETRFFQILRTAGLPLPERQRVVLFGDGSLAYVDFAYPGIDAVLEVLGYAYHSSRKQLKRGAERNNDLNLRRLTVLEFTWEHVRDERQYVVERVTRLLRDRLPH